MDIHELNKMLNYVIDQHAKETQNYMKSFHELTPEGQQVQIGSAFEEMNTQNNRALQGFKENIMKHLEK